MTWSDRPTARNLFLVACLGSLSSPPTCAQTYLYDGPGGATCAYYDVATGIKWRNRVGDWRDADGKSQGDRPFARFTVTALDTSRLIEIDVTSIVRSWIERQQPNFGLLIRGVGGSPTGIVEFHSREADDARVRPVLQLFWDDHSSTNAAPSADTRLRCSTIYSLGTGKTLAAGGDSNLLIRFALPPPSAERRLTRAIVHLTTTSTQYGDANLGVFLLDPPVTLAIAPPQPGLAALYPGDDGIERDPDVIFSERFESPEWKRRWSYVRETDTFDLVASDRALKFESLAGKALRVKVAKGNHMGLDARYRFAEEIGLEPEEIYFRYYLRLADDWRPTRDGGKLPGIAGTYNSGGWGGRKSNGKNGWSMRGEFGKVIEPQHPLAGRTPIGTYAYHAETAGSYGEIWPWSQGRPGVLESDRWYCIEQYFKVNMVGKSDGVFRAWIDGVPVFEKRDIRVRDLPALKIEEVWLDIYHGGTEVSPYDQHLYIDNVVIARKYIGPIHTR